MRGLFLVCSHGQHGLAGRVGDNAMGLLYSLGTSVALVGGYVMQALYFLWVRAALNSAMEGWWDMLLVAVVCIIYLVVIWGANFVKRVCGSALLVLIRFFVQAVGRAARLVRLFVTGVSGSTLLVLISFFVRAVGRAARRVRLSNRQKKWLMMSYLSMLLSLLPELSYETPVEKCAKLWWNPIEIF